MTATLLALVPTYGAWLVLAATFLSCLALPAPSSLIMLAAGAFVASGDLTLWTVIAAALGGAVLGDHVGYWLGCWAGAPLWQRLKTRPTAAKLLIKAEENLKRRDLVAVYLSRWLFSPLGPYVNLIAGATAMPHHRFSLADLAGEATWVCLYVGLGYAFGTQIEALSGTLGNLAGALAAGLVAVILGRSLLQAAREKQ